MKYIVAIFMLGVCIISCKPKPEPPKPEPLGVHKAIIGRWHLENVTGDGNINMEDKFAELEFTEDRMIYIDSDPYYNREFEYTINADSTIDGHLDNVDKIISVGSNHLEILNKIAEYGQIGQAPKGYQMQIYYYTKAK